MEQVAFDDDLQKPEPVAAGPVAWAGVAYGGDVESIREARRFVAGFLTRLCQKHGVEVSSRAAGAAELVASELVTNACKYAPGPCVLNVELAGAAVEITVWDTNPALPVVCAPDPGRIGGHGLEIVTAMCAGFEVVHGEPIGKRITARLLLEPAAG